MLIAVVVHTVHVPSMQGYKYVYDEWVYKVAMLCRLGIVSSLYPLAACGTIACVLLTLWWRLAHLRAKLYNKQRFKEKVAMRKRWVWCCVSL